MTMYLRAFTVELITTFRVSILRVLFAYAVVQFPALQPYGKHLVLTTEEMPSFV